MNIIILFSEDAEGIRGAFMIRRFYRPLPVRYRMISISLFVSKMLPEVLEYCVEVPEKIAQ